MCLIISVLFFVGAYSFYTHSLYFQMFLSLFLGFGILFYFVKRIIKNRDCFFNTSKCSKKERPKS